MHLRDTRFIFAQVNVAFIITSSGSSSVLQPLYSQPVELQAILAMDISYHSHLIIPIICSDWIKVFDQHLNVLFYIISMFKMVNSLLTFTTDLENADCLGFRIRAFRFIFLCLLC